MRRAEHTRYPWHRLRVGGHGFRWPSRWHRLKPLDNLAEADLRRNGQQTATL